MPQTLVAIGNAVGRYTAQAVTSAAQAAGVSAATAAQIGGIVGQVANILVMAAPGLILASTRPSAPGPEELRIPLKQARPVRQTGTGLDRISGPYMLFASNGSYSYDVFALHDGKVTSFDDWWLNDEIVTVVADVVQPIVTKYRFGFVEMQWRYGEATETAYSELVTALPAVWPSTARGDGIASLYLRCVAPNAENFQSRFPNGLPLPSVTAKLSAVYDPRDPDQDPDDASTWVWSKNAALNLLFYLCFTDSGPRIDYGSRVLPAIAHWIRAADVCDEPVALAAGGTTPRYEQGGTWTWDTAPAGVIGQFLDCMDGWMCRDSQGCIILKAGKYEAPSVTLTGADVLGFTLNRFQPSERAVNELVVSYKSPVHSFNLVQSDPWTNDDDIAAVGEVRSRPLSLPWVQTNSQARRLAKRAMARQGADATGTLTIDLFDAYEREIITARYLAVQLGENEPRTLRDIVVEVMGAEIDVISGLVTLSWIKADPGVDAWSTSEEGQGPAPGGYVPPPDTSAPVIVSVDTDGTPANIVVTVEDAGITGSVAWFIRYRADGTITWTEEVAGPTDIGTEIELRSSTIGAGTWEYQVRFLLIDLGVYSDWSDDPPGHITI